MNQHPHPSEADLADFTLELVHGADRAADHGAEEVPEEFLRLRQLRQAVDTPQEAPSVEEVLLHPDHGHRRTRISWETVHGLMRGQLRLAAALALGFFGLVVIINMGMLVIPELRELHLGGIPLEWLIPTVALTPLLVVVAVIYTRYARKQEQQLIDHHEHHEQGEQL